MKSSNCCFPGALLVVIGLAATACSGGDDNGGSSPGGGVPIYPSTTSPGTFAQPAALAAPGTGTNTAAPIGNNTTPVDMTQVNTPPVDMTQVDTTPVATEPSFSADVLPLFEERCAGCHINDRFNITVYAEAVEIADIILLAVQGEFTTSYGATERTMPYFCGNGVGQGTCLDNDDFELIRSWVEGSLLP